MKKQADRKRLYQMAVCPQFVVLSASPGGWGQVWGRLSLSLVRPQGGLFPTLPNVLTPVMDSWLSPEPYNPASKARDNMLAGVFRSKAGQVTTTRTNRLLESEES
jgi:hypothetical protein